jgi:hypothetical protein
MNASRESLAEREVLDLPPLRELLDCRCFHHGRALVHAAEDAGAAG